MKEADFKNLLQGIREAGSFLRGNKRAATRRTKLHKKWLFAHDAIGLVDRPSDLSRRKGLSGSSHPHS